MNFPSISSNTLVTLLSSFILAIYFRRRSKYVNGHGTAPVPLGSCKDHRLHHGKFPQFFLTDTPHDEHVNLLRKFGLLVACRVKSPFNRDVLYLADPKGLQYVLNTSGYNFHKRVTAKASKLFLGKNLLGVEGEEHARQRKMLLPSFSQSHLHEIVPAFVQVTSKLIERWKDMIASQQGQGIDVDTYTWLSSLTMDAFGQGVLSHDFGALSDKPTEYVKAVRGIFVDLFKDRSNAQLIVAVALGRAPEFVGRFLMSLSFSGANKFEQFLSEFDKICSSIIEREKEAIRLGKPASKDLLSVLVRANMDLDAKARLTDYEMMSQMHAFTVAGHDTTSSQLQWIFYELSRHPEAQNKIREEIRSIKKEKRVQELGPSELESLQYTAAVVKETLRYHPIALLTIRWAARDDIIPLAFPVKDASGKEVHSVRINEGQQVFVSMQMNGYRKDSSTTGKLNDLSGLCAYMHISSFSSGVHACIAWRFALLEMLVMVTDLVEHFEFAPIASNPTILKKVATTVYPSVKGETKASMPLSIKPIS